MNEFTLDSLDFFFFFFGVPTGVARYDRSYCQGFPRARSNLQTSRVGYFKNLLNRPDPTRAHITKLPPRTNCSTSALALHIQVDAWYLSTIPQAMSYNVLCPVRPRRSALPPTTHSKMQSSLWATLPVHADQLPGDPKGGRGPTPRHDAINYDHSKHFLYTNLTTTSVRDVRSFSFGTSATPRSISRNLVLSSFAFRRQPSALLRTYVVGKVPGTKYELRATAISRLNNKFASTDRVNLAMRVSSETLYLSCEVVNFLQKAKGQTAESAEQRG